MNRKKPTHSERPEISIEEWDFRRVSREAHLQTVTEYEYLRSSKLRGVIEKWQLRLFDATRVAKDIFNVRILRLAKLISIRKDSPLDKYDRLCGGLFEGKKCPATL